MVPYIASSVFMENRRVNWGEGNYLGVEGMHDREIRFSGRGKYESEIGFLSHSPQQLWLAVRGVSSFTFVFGHPGGGKFLVSAPLE